MYQQPDQQISFLEHLRTPMTGAATASPNNSSIVHHPDELRARRPRVSGCPLTRLVSAAKPRTGACCRASVKLLVLPLEFHGVNSTQGLAVR